MTYQGARARPLQSETQRVFLVSNMGWDYLGRPSHVRWTEVNAKTNADVGKPVTVSVADVIDAIHAGSHVAAVFLPPHAHFSEHALQVLERLDGGETIGLVRVAGQNQSHPAARLQDIAALAELTPPLQQNARPAPRRRRSVYAVSHVALDGDGRVTEVLWGPVDPQRNDWARPQSIASVLEVVAALRRGDQVFAMFPTLHGHLPDRHFVQANYDGTRDTIVLDGPAAYEREIHDMERLHQKSEATSV